MPTLHGVCYIVSVLQHWKEKDCFKQINRLINKCACVHVPMWVYVHWESYWNS